MRRSKPTLDTCRSLRKRMRGRSRRSLDERKSSTIRSCGGIVKRKLALRWSPEQIARYLKEKYAGDSRMQVSHESIYTYIYILPRGELRKELISYLRQGRRGRQRRKRDTDERGKIPNMVSIHERPKEVEGRTVPGHWESDLIIGKANASAVGTLVERTTRTTILVPLKAKDAETEEMASGEASGRKCSGTTPTGMNTNYSPRIPRCRCISPIRKVHGSAAPTRTRTNSYGSRRRRVATRAVHMRAQANLAA